MVTVWSLTLETQEEASDRKQNCSIAVVRDRKPKTSWSQCLPWYGYWARSVTMDDSSPAKMRRAERRRRTWGGKNISRLRTSTDPGFDSFLEGIKEFATVSATCRSRPEEDEGMRRGCTERKGVTLRVWALFSCTDTHTNDPDSLCCCVKSTETVLNLRRKWDLGLIV